MDAEALKTLAAGLGGADGLTDQFTMLIAWLEYLFTVSFMF